MHQLWLPLLSGLKTILCVQVEGHVTGMGNPEWAATHTPAASTAPAVQVRKSRPSRCKGYSSSVASRGVASKSRVSVERGRAGYLSSAGEQSGCTRLAREAARAAAGAAGRGRAAGGQGANGRAGARPPSACSWVAPACTRGRQNRRLCMSRAYAVKGDVMVECCMLVRAEPACERSLARSHRCRTDAQAPVKVSTPARNAPRRAPVRH